MEQEKPRRLEADTIAYVTGLKPTLVRREGEEEEEAEAERMSLLVGNVLDELKSRLASVACDRHTHEVLETLVSFASLPQLLVLMTRLASYAVFLASNRHASHILQTIMSHLVRFMRQGETADTLHNVVVSFAAPLIEELPFLAADISGSHVIRSLISLLIGVPVVAEKKGKASKHRHSVALGCPLESITDPALFTIHADHFIDTPPDFERLLIRGIELLLSLSKSDLLAVCVSPSGSVVLGLLTRSLLSTGNPRAEARLHMQRLLQKIIEPKEQEDCVYGLAGERGGSYLLEAILECCPVTQFKSIVEDSIVGRVKEYAADAFGNFVLQSCLRRSTSELTGNFDSKSEIFSLAETVLAEALGCDAEGPIDLETFRDLLKTRGGVALWLLSTAKALASSSTSSSWFPLIASTILKCWEGSSRLCDALPSLLAEEKGADRFDGSRGQLLVGRLLKVLLSSEGAAGDCVLKGLSFLSKEHLLSIATSPQLSKLILDSIYDVSNAARVRSTDGLRLTHTIISISVELATHFIGQHVLRRLFERVGEVEKELIAQRIVGEREKIGRSKEGRNSLREVQADLLSSDPKEWRTVMKRRVRAEQVVEELKGLNGCSKVKSGAENSIAKQNTKVNDEDNDKEDNEEGAQEQTGKRKRKRKRSGKSA